jgi:hypothetical protein
MNKNSQSSFASKTNLMNNLLVRSLHEIGNKKFLLDMSLLEPVVQSNIGDAEWLADRLGLESIIDSDIYGQPPKANVVVVANIKDLIALAEQAAIELKKIITSKLMNLENDSTGIGIAMEIMQLLSCT